MKVRYLEVQSEIIEKQYWAGTTWVERMVSQNVTYNITHYDVKVINTYNLSDLLEQYHQELYYTTQFDPLNYQLIQQNKLYTPDTWYTTSDTTNSEITENSYPDTDVIYGVDKIYRIDPSSLPNHINDVIFTEDSLKSFIKRIRNNIRDNLAFASTASMAQKENYDDYTDAEKEISDVFENWDTEHFQELCIINREIAYDPDNLENGRYTWINGGSFFEFERELEGFTNVTRPEGTFFINENKGAQSHVVSIRGFNDRGDFSNRKISLTSPTDPAENREDWDSITTNILYADEIGSPDFPVDKAYIKEGYFDEINLNEDGSGLYIHSTDEAYRFLSQRQRTYDEYELIDMSSNFEDYDSIKDIPRGTTLDPNATVLTTIPTIQEENAYGFNETTTAFTKGYASGGTDNTPIFYQSANNAKKTFGICKINFVCENETQVTIYYEHRGSNYSLISQIDGSLLESYSTDPSASCLLRTSSSSSSTKTLTITIPAGEHYVLVKHCIGTTKYSNDYLKFIVVLPSKKNLFDSKRYYKYIGSQSNGAGTIRTWQSYTSDKLYNYNEVKDNITHLFTGGPAFDYIGEETDEDMTYQYKTGKANTEGFDWITENYNVTQPIWIVSNNKMYVRILATDEIKNHYNNDEILYVNYDDTSKEYKYYVITSVYQEFNSIQFLSSLIYNFSQVETPSNLENYSQPGEAIQFKSGPTINAGGWGSAQVEGTNTVIFDDYVYSTAISNSGTTLIPYLDELCDVQIDLIPGVTIVEADENNPRHFIKESTDLTNIKVKIDDNYQDPKLETDYTDYVNNFYRQISFDNLEDLLSEDPALGKDGTTTPIYLEGSIRTDGGIAAKKSIKGFRVHAAVFNDYAEYRQTDINEPGRCVIELGDGNMTLSSNRLQAGANIISDTFGFSIGETILAQTPIAVCGRVLAYPMEEKSEYMPGDAVCSGENGTISKMTREEIKEWPDRIVGFVSEIPNYECWGSNNVPVNGRIWIKIK